MIAVKTCSRCKQTLPVSSFGVARANRDGRNGTCKPCNVARKSEWRLKNPERYRAWNKSYYADNAERLNEVSTAWAKANRPRMVEIQLEYRRRNPEAAAAQSKATSQKRRAQKMGAPAATLTTAEWNAIVESFDSRCAYCLEKLDRPQQDHVVALSRGGEHTANNVVPACAHCNSSKNNRPVWALLNS